MYRNMSALRTRALLLVLGFGRELSIWEIIVPGGYMVSRYSSIVATNDTGGRQRYWSFSDGELRTIIQVAKGKTVEGASRTDMDV